MNSAAWPIATSKPSAPGTPLQSTALVHEAYLRLVDQEPLRLGNRARFFAVAVEKLMYRERRTTGNTPLQARPNQAHSEQDC
jgi:hypothetical protein